MDTPISQEPDVADAADKTADEHVLGVLWEITKRRLDEEDNRRLALADRASKMITYNFTLIAGSGVLLAILKDVIREAAAQNTCGWWSLVGFICAFGAAVLGGAIASLRACFAVYSVRGYQTWGDGDLERVDLGGADNEFGYLRYMIKHAWTFIKPNLEINNSRFKEIASATESFKIASWSFSALIAVIALTNAALGWKNPPASSPQAVKVECMANDNSQKPSQAPQPTKLPTPTPRPSAGQKIEKSEKGVGTPLGKPPATRSK
jgi:hypothetical protein